MPLIKRVTQATLLYENNDGASVDSYSIVNVVISV